MIARTLLIALALVAAPAVAAAQPALSAVVPAPPRHAVWVAIPSLDGFAGLELGGELGVRPRVGAVVAVSARHSASGDYSGWITGVAGELRWYWRGGGRWSQVDGLERDGWFLGGRLDLARSTLSMGDRAVGTTVIGGLAGELGYRLTPYRRLAVTGLVSLGGRWERDTDGRLAGYGHGALGLGLEVGWLF